MKKLKLNLQDIEGAEILTKAQLKNVLGGTGSITTNAPITTTGICSGTVGYTFPCYCNGEFQGCYDDAQKCVDSCL